MNESKITEDDRKAFIEMQREIRGSEYAVPDDLGSRVAQQPAQNMFSMYREALGAPEELKLSNGQTVIVVQPKVKTVKYLLSKADKFGELAKESATAVLDEFQKIMCQCLDFPDGKPDDVNEWYEDLPSSDGMDIAEAFGRVFDIKFLMSRASQLPGK